MLAFQLYGPTPSLLIASSFSQSHNNNSNKIDRSRSPAAPPITDNDDDDDDDDHHHHHDHQQQHNSYGHRLLPASSRIRLEFSSTATTMPHPATTTAHR
jgi:heme-degrading monooxygenase HmoA